MTLITNPFGSLYSDREYNVQLDAVYILTLSNRQLPATDISWLFRYSRKVILVFSDEYAAWVDSVDDRVQIERLADGHFIDEYIDYPGNCNMSNKYRPRFDIPAKRSYILHEARNNGEKRILLLDDDIQMTDDNMIAGLSGLSKGKAIVGFHVIDYPDVSTLDHLERIICNTPNIISMTGSCLFINTGVVKGDFPNVYNEDLFFFLQQDMCENIVSGGCIAQAEYCPWECVERIKHEQFGDLIYEAIKKKLINADYSGINWHEEIQLRKERVRNLIDKTNEQLFQKSLRAAYEALEEINVGDIREFVRSTKWADWVKSLL